MQYTALLISIILGVAGQILLKLSIINPIISKNNAYIINLYFLSAFIVYVSSLLLYVYSLNKIPLTFAYPMVSVSYIGVAIASKYVFGTHLGFLDLFGFAFIVAGVSMIAVSQSA
jgi:small multidrug resistance pump